MSSLRDIYKQKRVVYEQELQKRQGFIYALKCVLWPFNFKDIVVWKGMNRFICHNCLKTVLIDKLDFQCPFCDKEYNKFKTKEEYKESAEQLEALAHFFKCSLDFEGKEKALFDQCTCGSKIQFVECYHCNKPINLFAPYNEKELEAKRYV